MSDFQITAKAAETHRQDLITEATLHNMAKTTRKPRRFFPSVSRRRSATRLAIAR